MANFGDEALWRYNCQDCCITFEVDEVLQQIVQARGLSEQAEFQNAMYYPVLDTMIRGCEVDTRMQKQLVKELSQSKREGLAWLEQVVGHPLNPSSPKQLSTFFYEELGLPPIRNRATGGLSTNEESLRKLLEKEPLILGLVNKIEELRSIGVFLGTFLGESKSKYNRGLLDEDGKLRCSYSIGGTTTFRFSSSASAFGYGTNLQNWSKGD